MSNVQVKIYQTADGKLPFIEWLHNLKDKKTSAQVKTRINRIRNGNFGDFKSVGDGVSEIRIDVVPGYRVYCGRWGDSLVVILCGGSKSGQAKDIAKAKEYWADWKGRH